MRFEKKFFYYYLRDRYNNPFSCICICYDYEDCKFSRGISLCSKEDSFIKKFARKLAYDRCIHAVYSKKNSLPINYEVEDTSNLHLSIILLEEAKDKIPLPYKFMYKSEFSVNISPYESEIVKDEI